MIPYIPASVGELTLFDGQNNVVLYSNVLTTSGVDIAGTVEQVRGGNGAALIFQYFHSSDMTMSLENPTFSLEWMLGSCGGNITVGGNDIYQENITTTVLNQITVTKTPQPFGKLASTDGWYKLAGSSNSWTKITFVGNVANVVGLAVGTNVCVRYNVENSAMRVLSIPSIMVPKIYRARLTVPTFGIGVSEYSSNNQIGQLVYDIDAFQLDVGLNMAFASTGVATTAVTGKALRSENATNPCDTFGQYGTLKEIFFNEDEFTNLTAMAVDGNDIQLNVNDTETLKIIGVYGNYVSTKPLSNTKLTFTSSAQSIASVSDAGVVTAATAGTAFITVSATSKPDIICNAKVTVS